MYSGSYSPLDAHCHGVQANIASILSSWKYVRGSATIANVEQRKPTTFAMDTLARMSLMHKPIVSNEMRNEHYGNETASS